MPFKFRYVRVSQYARDLRPMANGKAAGCYIGDHHHGGAGEALAGWQPAGGGRVPADLVVIPHLSVVEIDQAVARRAADLRAKHGIRTPDALQIAAALIHGATGFNRRACRGSRER